MGKLAEIVGDGNLKDTINAISIDDNKMSVDEQIEFYIKNKMPFMLHGMSGVGKSRRIKDIDPDYVSIYLRNGMVPEEVIGKTIYPNNDTTQVGKWIAPSWYGDLCEKCEREKDKVHVLFIDELTNAKETVQSFAYHLVLEHSIAPNLGKLPDNCVVVCAGNSRNESEAANIIPEPLFRRFVAHIYLEPKVSDWVQWGQKIDKDTGHDRIHPIVRAFVSYNNKLFCSKYDPENPPKYALDPRAWEQVSDVIYANGGKIAIEIIENKIGKDNAIKFINFAKQYVAITIQDIISGNYDRSDLPTKADEIYAFVLSLVPANNEQVGKVRDFIQANFGNEYLAKYDVAWIGDDFERALVIDTINKQKIAKPIASKIGKEQGQGFDKSANITDGSAKIKSNKSKNKFVTTIDECLDKNSPKPYKVNIHGKAQYKILARVLDSRGATRHSGAKFEEWTPRNDAFIIDVRDGTFETFRYITNIDAIVDISEIDMVNDLTLDEIRTVYGDEIYQDIKDGFTESENSANVSNQTVKNTQSNTQAVQVSGQPTHKYTIDEFLNSKDRLILQIDINSDDMFAQKFIKEIKKKTQIKGVPTAKQFAEQEGNVLNFNNFDSFPCEICRYRVFELEDVDFSRCLTESELMFLYHDNPPTTYKLSLDEFFNSNKDVAIKVTGYERKQLIKQTMEDYCGHYFGNIGNVNQLDRTKLFAWLPTSYVHTTQYSSLSSQEYSKMLGVEDIDISSIPALADAYKKYMAKNNYTNKPIDYQEIFKCM